MSDNWTDFEKMIFKKVETIENEVVGLKIWKAKTIGILIAVSIISSVAMKVFL